MRSRSLVRFRSFRIADYDEVHALWKKTPGIGLNESDGRGEIARFLKRNPALSQVAISGGRVIGAVLCGHDGRRGYLHHLVVARKWRHQGVGRTLVASCLAKLRLERIPKCNLFLFTRNLTGRAFWRRIGWTIRADLRLVQCGIATGSVYTRTNR
jgi:N-acetylglutamate synthase